MNPSPQRAARRLLVQLVTGGTKLFTPNGYFDLATLEPEVGNPHVLAQYDKSKDIV